jgi:hypothetical protein
VGSARLCEARRPGRADDCRSPTLLAKLGPAGGITREIRQQLAGVGRTCVTPSHPGSDVGLARGASRAGRRHPGSTSDLGIARASRRTGTELERSACPACGRPGTFVGRACASGVAAVRSGTACGRPVVGSARRAGTLMGRAGRSPCTGNTVTRRSGNARGDIVEPARPRMGPAEAGIARAASADGRPRMGRTGRSAAGDCCAVLGRAAGCGLMGCAKGRGARGSRRAGVVGAGARCAVGATGRRSTAVERTRPDRVVVGSRGCSRRTCGSG